MISIHASAKEATLLIGKLSAKIDFNPRLREGGDSICITDIERVFYFNPRLREGGDPLAIILPPPYAYFNPRLREGGDKNLQW